MSPPSPATPLESIGGYRLLAPIGQGGMGAVYAADREIVTGVHRRFAIKILHPQLEVQPGVAGELLEEARLAATIRHPNVVQVVEAAEDRDRVFLVMDYVEGATLSALLRKAHADSGAIPPAIVGRILRDALTGLDAAHHATAPDGTPLELVHRDFSPQNLLVGIDGVTRLTDFGIAKAIGRTSATATGTVKGKVGYMAPEQARGLPLDGRCDVWAAGVVLWEALTGRRLFDADNDAAVILDIVSGADPPPPSSFRLGIGPEVDALVARALVRRRGDRMPSARAFAEALDQAFAEMASPEAVGHYVQDTVGEELRTRATAIAQAEQNERPTGQPTPAADDGVTVPMTEVTPSVSATPTTQDRPVWRWVAIAVLAAGLVGIGLVLSDGETSGASVPDSAVPDSRAPPSAPTPPADDTTFLDVVADRPVVSLRFGARAPIALPEPTNRFRVPTGPIGSGGVTLQLRARDGRVATVTVAEGQREATVTFPAPTATATARASTPPPVTRPPKRPPVPSPPPPPPGDDDLLAPTP